MLTVFNTSYMRIRKIKLRVLSSYSTLILLDEHNEVNKYTTDLTEGEGGSRSSGPAARPQRGGNNG